MLESAAYVSDVQIVIQVNRCRLEDEVRYCPIK
jgi:hypothetical protein